MVLKSQFYDRRNLAYPIERNETVSCVICDDYRFRQKSENEYSYGEAFLVGPSHSPLDANANYVCRDHLDSDAIIVHEDGTEEDGRAYNERKKERN